MADVGRIERSTENPNPLGPRGRARWRQAQSFNEPRTEVFEPTRGARILGIAYLVVPLVEATARAAPGAASTALCPANPKIAINDDPTALTLCDGDRFGHLFVERRVMA